jgi:hypothetical protein
MHAVRRAHLYLGLFLLPWAVLYGATGFLFNHPAAFADAPTAHFGRAGLAGTPMEHPPAPAEVAEQVVAALRARATPPADYRLAHPEQARWTREFAFATVKADRHEVSVLVDVTGAGGTVRSKALPPPRPEEKAPFAVGVGKAPGPKGGTPRPAADGLALDAPLPERVKAAVPAVLERTGFPGGPVTVTSVPDLTFLMADGPAAWRVTFNPQTGAVTGRPADDAVGDELSVRRFLTRLHLAHGYPGEPGARWFWAVVVDVMAFVMVFWGVSGLFMWWQLKAARRWGLAVLVLSAAAATALGLGMHEAMTTR